MVNASGYKDDKDKLAVKCHYPDGKEGRSHAPDVLKMNSSVRSKDLPAMTNCHYGVTILHTFALPFPSAFFSWRIDH